MHSGSLLRSLACFVFMWLGLLYRQLELAGILAVKLQRLDLGQAGQSQPVKSILATHQAGDQVVAFSGTFNGNMLAGQPYRSEVNAFGNGACQLVKHVRSDRAIALQVLNHLGTLDQLLAFLTQLLNLLDASIQRLVFTLNEAVARQLLVDQAAEYLITNKNQGGTQHDHADQGGDKLLLALLPKLFAPGQKVNTSHQSKLLIARPHAIISAGASLASASTLTLLSTAILANGLAITVSVPITRCTMVSSPEMAELPPASKI